MSLLINYVPLAAVRFMCKNNMFMEPLITIAIPTYNTPINDFKRSMASALNQDYQNLEILISDQSQDDIIANYCFELAKNDKRISYHKNSELSGGVYKNREWLLANFKGDYLSFLDSDDYIDLNVISSLYKAIKSFQNCENAISYCDFIKVSDKKSVEPSTPSVSICEIGSDDIFTYSLINGFDAVWRMLFPKKLVFKMIVEEKNGFDDMQIVANAAIFAKHLVKVTGPRYFYYMNSNSIMHSDNYPLLQAYKAYNYRQDLYAKLRQKRLPELDVFSTLEKAKLECVNYDGFDCSNLRHTKKELKSLLKENKNMLLPKGVSRQAKLLCLSPLMFAYLFRKHRHVQTNSNHPTK